MKHVQWIIEQATGNKRGNMGAIYSGTLEGIRLFLKDHPSANLPTLNGSLAKRITGYLENFFSRLLADKYMMNWLSENRIDLSKLDGEFRNALFQKIKSQECNPNFQKKS